MLDQVFRDKIPDEQNRKEILTSLHRRYPFVNIGTLSRSLCKRDINYIQIGNARNQVLFAGAFHGMEWITCSLLLCFAKNVCAAVQERTEISDIKIGEFLKKRGLFIIPCINPDGVEISLYGAAAAGDYKDIVETASRSDTSSWQANARGVDINHNFDAGWQELHALERASNIFSPAPTRYGGEKPESEPETRALTTICKFINISHVLAFHSQGEEIYWRYGDDTPEKSALMAKIMSVSSGYKVASPSGLAVGGGFKDWFIEKRKRPGFTIEIGKGKNPLPLKDLSDIYATLEELMVLAAIM